MREFSRISSCSSGSSSAMGCFTGIVTTWIKYRSKRVARRRMSARDSDEIADRMAKLDNAVDAMAVEVERISEGQRFVTKLLADRGRDARAARRRARGRVHAPPLGNRGNGGQLDFSSRETEPACSVSSHSLEIVSMGNTQPTPPASPRRASGDGHARHQGFSHRQDLLRSDPRRAASKATRPRARWTFARSRRRPKNSG